MRFNLSVEKRPDVFREWDILGIPKLGIGLGVTVFVPANLSGLIAFGQR